MARNRVMSSRTEGQRGQRRAGGRTDKWSNTGRVREQDRGADRRKRQQESRVTETWDREQDRGTEGGRLRGRKGEAGDRERDKSKRRAGNNPETEKQREGCGSGEGGGEGQKSDGLQAGAGGRAKRAGEQARGTERKREGAAS